MIDVIEMLNVAANLSRYLIASFQGEFEKAILKQSLDTCYFDISTMNDIVQILMFTDLVLSALMMVLTQCDQMICSTFGP